MKEKAISDEEIINEFKEKGELHFMPLCRNCTHDVIDLAMTHSNGILVYVDTASQEEQMYNVHIYDQDTILEEDS